MLSDFVVAVCFTLNYIIGTGFLTLPWAFHQTGYIIGSLTLLILTVFSVYAVIFILETLARAEAMRDPSNKPIKFCKVQNTGYNAIISSDSEHGADSHFFEIESTEDIGRNSMSSDSSLLVKDVKYEIIELAEMFLGSWGKYLYSFFIITYLFSTLWVYATVFALAYSSNDNLGAYSYQIYIIIFSVFVIPVSLMDFKEQASLQVVLSMCRVLMVVTMVGSVVYAEFTNATVFGDYHPTSEATKSISMEQLWKIYLLLPIAAYANIFHHSIPALSQLVENKRELNGVFTTALVIAVLSYTSIGIIISGYFQEFTNISSNLNWKAFHGILNADGTVRLSAKIISTFVVLFPALDVASAFPLNAITLANSLLTLYDPNASHEGEHTKTSIAFRLLAVIPPIIGAYFISNLGSITHFAGLSGFAIAFIFPALLAYYSKIKLENMGIPYATYYSFPFASSLSNILTLFVGVGLLVFVGYCLIVFGPVD